MKDDRSVITKGLHRLFDAPWVFDVNQAVLDGGKQHHILDFLDGISRKSVVDIGCGTGLWSHLATSSYLGIDSSESFIAGCRRRFRGDTSRQFVLADATTVHPEEQFDLALLISVLHHLDVDGIRGLLDWVSRSARRLFVLDLFPNDKNPLSRWLYSLDRGDFIRSPEEQRTLLESEGRFRVTRSGSFYSWNRIYRHTMFLAEPIRQ
jgi:SAM-dependent methyltransferase